MLKLNTGTISKNIGHCARAMISYERKKIAESCFDFFANSSLKCYAPNAALHAMSFFASYHNAPQNDHIIVDPSAVSTRSQGVDLVDMGSPS